MSLLCKPAVVLPKNILTQEDTLRLCQEMHCNHPQLELALQLIKNTGVQKRHLIQPVELALQHPGVEARHKIYIQESRRMSTIAIKEALENAHLTAKDIQMIIAVSCTGFLFPSLTAYLINDLKFSPHTKQLPIAQLGCAAGGAAINRAKEYCMAYPDHNVLIVAVEFCSLLYQPTDTAVSSLLAGGLFGDAVSAAVMKGKKRVDDSGLRIDSVRSYLIPHTENYISYDIKDTGWHFVLDKRVRETIAPIVPVMELLLREEYISKQSLEYFILHSGGPRILKDLAELLDIEEEKITCSRECLANLGNVASVVVFEVIRRFFSKRGAVLPAGVRGLLGGFGPGITAEINVGTWIKY